MHENTISQNLKSRIPFDGVPLRVSRVRNMEFSVTLTVIFNFLSRMSASGCLSQIQEHFLCINPAMT